MIRKVINKYKRMPLTAKAALWFVFCSMLRRCIAFLTVPFFTRLMPSSEYGLYSTYLSWLAIITTICTLNIHSVVYINSYTKANTNEEKDMVAIPLLSLSMVITVVIGIIYLIFNSFFNQITGLTTAMSIFLFIEILFEIPVNFWCMKKRFEYKYISMVVLTILLVLVNSIVGIFFVYFASTNHALIRVISVVLGYFIIGFILYIDFVKRARKCFSTVGWKHALEVQLPLLPHGLSLNILTSSDRIMISKMVGVVEAGVYSVAYSAGYIVNVIKTSIIDALKPWIYAKLKSKKYDDIKNTMNITMVLVLLITIVFISFGPEIVRIMAPSSYNMAIYIIPPVAASSFFTFLYNIFAIVGMYYEKTKKMMIASIVGAILNLILNYIFIPIFGFVAAGFTTLVCYIVFAIINYYIMKSICKTNLDNAQIYDIKFIEFLSIVVIIITIIFELIYKFIVLRYSIIVLIIGILLLKKELFISELKKISGKKKKKIDYSTTIDDVS